MHPESDLQLSMVRSVISSGPGFDTEYTREGELTTVTFSTFAIRTAVLHVDKCNTLTEYTPDIFILKI